MIKEHVNRIPVHMDGKTIYDIVLEDSFDSLAKEISVLGTEKKKICIIADSNVADIYLDEVTRILFGCCREVTSYVFPAGEENTMTGKIFSSHWAAALRAISAALSQLPISAALILSRSRQPCYPRWTPGSAERRGLILIPTKIWSAPSICRNLYTRTCPFFAHFRTTSFPAAWERSSNTV